MKQKKGETTLPVVEPVDKSINSSIREDEIEKSAFGEKKYGKTFLVDLIMVKYKSATCSADVPATPKAMNPSNWRQPIKTILPLQTLTSHDFLR